MLQNVKNFFIAFLAGLIVFGASALGVLYIIRKSDNGDSNRDRKVSTKEYSQTYTVDEITDSEETASETQEEDLSDTNLNWVCSAS